MGESEENIIALGFSPVTPRFIETLALHMNASEGAKGISFVSRPVESLLLTRLYVMADVGIDEFEMAVWASTLARSVHNARIMLQEIARRLEAGDGDKDELLSLAYRIFAVAEERING